MPALKKIEIPSNCPACGAGTSMDGAYVICTNMASCGAQITARFLNFLRAVDIKGFGTATVEYLIFKDKLTDLSDFYKLSPYDFESTKIGMKLCQELKQKATSMTLPVFIDALGIPGIGQHATELMMTKYPTLQDLLDLSVLENVAEELVAISGIGAGLAQMFVYGFRPMRGLIDKLMQHVTIIEPEKTETTGVKCAGWVVVFTGVRDAAMEDLIRSQGGEVVSGMSKRVTHVVAKEVSGSSSKLKKAREAGLAVVSIYDLEGMVNG